MNRVKLIAKKTQLIWLSTGQQLAKLTVTQLHLSTSVVEFNSVVTDLGIVLDNQLSMGAHSLLRSLPFPDPAFTICISYTLSHDL